MGAKEKRQQERLDAINKRKQEVIRAAKDLFAIKTIEATSMQDIADEAEVGVASVYRYYRNKMDLVYAVASDYIDKALDDYDVELHGSGLDKVEQLIDYLINQYTNKGALLSFVEQFEVFLMTHKGEKLDVFKELQKIEIKLLTDILIEGVGDGSIRADVDVGKTTITIINLYRMIGQKLAFELELLHDGVEAPDYQLEIYKDMMLKYLTTTA